MSLVIRWEEPPPPAKPDGGGGRVSRLTPLADELRAQRGRWALVHEGDSRGAAGGMATHIRLGQVRAFAPAGDFDAVSRRRDDGKFCTWAIYLGDDE